jgi:hypothetical protein
MSKVAVIVETRKHRALEFVLNNVMSILPNEWNLQIFHGTHNKEYIKDIINIDPLLSSIKSRITLSNLNIKEVTQEDSSKIMLSESLWESIIGETVLYFECDSLLCPNSKYKVDDFTNFDYIGGYWGNALYNLDEKYPVVMNGGVSIRKKSFMLDIIKNKWKTYIERGGNPCEDYFVSHCVKNRPTTKEVLTFSIDCGYILPPDKEVPFALHKPWGVNPNKGHGVAYRGLKLICKEIEQLKKLQENV